MTGALTSAVVVRVDNAATQPKSPPELSAGVAAIVMGATTHDHNAVFFTKFLIDVQNYAHGPPPPLLKRPYRSVVEVLVLARRFRIVRSENASQIITVDRRRRNEDCIRLVVGRRFLTLGHRIEAGNAWNNKATFEQQ